jgi:bleomycin hydrolase
MAKVITDTPGAVKAASVQKWREEFEKSPARRVTMNALTRNSLDVVGLACETINTFDFSFSNEIEVGGPPTDQERAGTCWLFADINYIRWLAAKKLRNKDFTFSHNFHEFYDKLEKANYFLEKMIEWRGVDMLDPKLVHFLKTPTSDGGDWHYTVACLAKYGLAPTNVMPDTFNLKSTKFLNDRLGCKCREGALRIRELAKKGKGIDEMRRVKEEVLGEVFQILVCFLGMPPDRFSWGYWDDGPKPPAKGKGKKPAGKKKYHRFENVTPQEFAKKALDLDPDDFVVLMNLPVDGYPMNQPYTVELNQNTVGARDAIFLNVDMKHLKDAAQKSILKGEPVLFSADALPHREAKLGFYHHRLFDHEAMFDMKFPMDRSQAITSFQTQSNHLQMFIGVDLVKGKPVKWKLENSWGKQFGKNGLFMMSDGWFEEYLFTVMVRRKFVPSNILKLLEKKVKVIPFGAPFA